MEALGRRRVQEEDEGEVSEALEKNRRALLRAGGDGARPELIGTARIGVWAGGDARLRQGRLLAEALGDLLGRFWRNIDVGGRGRDAVFDAAAASARACGSDSQVRRTWHPPYNFAIGIGADAPPGSAADGVAVWADGWRSGAGSQASLGVGANPVGPLVAAALASAEAVKSVFSIGAARGAERLPASYEWDAREGTGEADPGEDGTGLDLGVVHMFGVGAVSHAMLWALARWPGGVAGTLHLVDPDAYDAGNPQRYMGTTAKDIGRPKAPTVADRLRRACPSLDVRAHETDMNSYFGDTGDFHVRTAVCGLDSAEARRQLGLKLPCRIVNMWTSGFHAGASTFSFGGDWPCIHCAYPEPTGTEPSEVALIQNAIGLEPSRIRELLGSGRRIDEKDAEIIAGATGMPADEVPLKPIRGVRADMCATGRIAAPGGREEEEADVPLAFSSAMAGAAGFTELLLAARSVQREPGQFQASVLTYPTRHSWKRRARNAGCHLCTESVRRLVRDKYGGMEVQAQ